MKKNIEILTLSGCMLCEGLKKLLDRHNIEYTTIDANENTELSSKVELLLGINNYPIIIQDIGIAGNHYHYLAFTILDEPTRTLSNGDMATGHTGEETILKYLS